MSDCYGRSVYYHDDTTYNLNVPTQYPQFSHELEYVSQIVPSGTANPPNKAIYGYCMTSNLEGDEQIQFLHTVSVPSAIGAGLATFTINCDPNTEYVSSEVDSEGNTTTFTSVDQYGNPIPLASSSLIVATK